MDDGFGGVLVDDFEGFEGISPDLRTCTIRQKARKDQSGKTIADAGVFQWSDTTPDCEKLALIVLAISNERHWWKGGFGGGNPPHCASPNAKTGVSNDPEYNGRACAECPQSKFGADRTPPPCGRGLKLLCLDSDLKPFILKFSESGIALTQDALKPMVHNRQVGPPFKYLMQVTLTFVQKGEGYFVPNWPHLTKPEDSARVRQVKPETFEKIRQIRGDVYPIFQALCTPPAELAKLNAGNRTSSLAPGASAQSAVTPAAVQPAMTVRDQQAARVQAIAEPELPPVASTSTEVLEAVVVETPASPPQQAEYVTTDQVAAEDPFGRL
jgi:hypothetical protein